MQHSALDIYPSSPSTIDKDLSPSLFQRPSPLSDTCLGAGWPIATPSVATLPPNPALTAMGDLLHNHQGQITPPEDAWDLEWPLEEETILELPDHLLSAAHPKRRTSSVSDHPATDGRIDKRDKYREKNRVAAAKCRAKKKDHVDGLEDNHRTQSMLNALLKQTEQSLRDELSFWRTQALQHGFCDCHSIQDYNLRKARALAANQDFGSVDGLRRDSMACTSPTAQAGHMMYPTPHDFESAPDP